MFKKARIKTPEEEFNSAMKNMDVYVFGAYQDAINYYREASRANKKRYRLYKSLTVILSAVVTLISALALMEYTQKLPWLQISFAIATPVIAAILTVISGLSQSFQWGATWRDMSIHERKIIGVRDCFLATEKTERNYIKAFKELDSIILNETESFFKRLLDSQIAIPEAERGEGVPGSVTEIPAITMNTNEQPSLPAPAG